MNTNEVSRARGVIASGLIKTGLVGTAMAVMLLQPAPAGAQQTELDALRAQIAEMQARLEKLETAQNTATETAKATPATTAKVPVAVSLLAQVNTRTFFNQKGPGSNSVDTFQLRRGELKVTGTILSAPAGRTLPRLTGVLIIDPAKQAAATSTSTVVAPPAGSPPGTLPTVTTVTTPNQATNPLQELMVSYVLREKAAADWTGFDIGQYKIPVGYEGDLTSSSALPTVDRALMFQARDPFGGGVGDIRDSGARVRGAAGPLEYQFMISNGLGERQNTLAGGSPKSYLARLMYTPASMKGLNLGISGAVGNDRGIPTGTGRVKRNLVNVFGNYLNGPWSCRAEYLTGKNQVLFPLGVTRNIRSYYALAGYKFTPKIEGVLRLDRFDFDKNLIPKAGLSSDTRADEITAGLNYYIKGQNAKIQANIVHRNGGAGLIGGNGFGSNATGFGKSSTQLRTNFQLYF